MTAGWILQVTPPNGAPFAVHVLENVGLGRAEGNQVCLQDPKVSSRHARVERQGGDWVIRDLGSRNGTEVAGMGRSLHNGEAQVLQHGMRIRLGNTAIEVQSNAGATLVQPAPDPNRTLVQNPAKAGQPTLQQPPPVVPPPAPARPVVPSAAPSPPPTPVPPPAPPVPQPAAPPPPTPRPHEHPAAAATPDVPAARPSSSPAPDSFYSPTIPVVLDGQGLDAAAKVQLTKLGARLVILDDADKQVLSLDAQEVTLGRSKEMTCALTSGTVSYRHAKLAYLPTQHSFTVQDIGSSNGTFRNGSPVSGELKQKLEPEDFLEFGTGVFGVYRVDCGADMREFDPGRDQSITNALVRQGRLSQAKATALAKQAKSTGLPLGDAVLLSGLVRAADWHGAAEQVKYRGGSTGTAINGKLIAAVAVLVVVGLVLAWHMGLFSA